ncbi:MAG: hypothetical protein ACWA6X_03845 [Bauldia sp.]
MTIAEDDVGLDALPRRLDAAVRRVRTDRLVATLTIAAAAAFVAFGFLEFASVSFGLPLDVGGRCAVAAALGLAVAAMGTAADMFTWPGRIALARRADLRLRLDERLSTAIEVAARGDHAGAPVERALLADAERRAASIDPGALAPLPFGRYGLVLAAAVAFAAMSLAPPDPFAGGTPRSALPSSTTLTEAEATDTGAELRRVATILERDAAARDDPFLEALAREAARIGEAIETGRLTDRGAVVAALDRLTGFTAEAYPAAAASTAGSYEDPAIAIAPQEAEATQMLRNLARERMTPPNAANEGGTTPEQPAVEPAANAPADIPPGPAPPTAEVPNSQAPGADGGGQPAGGAPAPAADDGYIEAAAMETVTDPTSYRADAQAGERPEDAVPIGPATAANTGQSRFAGAGQQLLAGAPAPAQDPFALGADMLLTGPLDETGRRIRIEAPPEMQVIAIAPAEATAMTWAPRREIEARRTVVPLAARDVLARYFRAAAEAE